MRIRQGICYLCKQAILRKIKGELGLATEEIKVKKIKIGLNCVILKKKKKNCVEKLPRDGNR